MNLLDLAVKIGVKDEASDKISGITEGAIARASAMGHAMYDATKFVATKAVDMVSGFAQSVIKGYGDFEQMKGGIEKLYGDAADTVIANSEKAFREAGMNQNQYLQASTTLAASLIKSLGGDMDAAAERNATAMKAIADNADTFGTSVEDVSAVYTSLSKGMYQTLDNLYLGYAGTKTGMEQLIADANEYAKSIGESGDMTIDSFADIVRAIDLIQQKEGIAGTTAKEAMTTIQGSLRMLRNGWSDFVAAVGSGDIERIQETMDEVSLAIFGQWDEELGKRTGGVINNIMPVLKNIAKAVRDNLPSIVSMVVDGAVDLINETFGTNFTADGIISKVQKIAGTISSVVGDVFSFLEEHGDELATAFIIVVDVMSAVAGAISTVASVVGPFVPVILGAVAAIKGFMFVQTLISTFTMLGATIGPLTTIFATFGGPIATIAAALGGWPVLIAAIVGAIVAFIATNDSAKEAIVLAWQAVVDFFTGIPEWWSTLWDGVSAKIGEFVTKAGEAWEDLKTAAAEKWEALNATISQKAEAIKNGVNQAWENVKTTTKNAWDNVKTSTTEKWQSIKDTATQKVQALKDAVSERVQALKDAVSTFWDNLKTATIDKWESIRQKATDAANNMKNAVSNAVESLKNAVRDKFDAVVNFAREMPSRIVNALSDLSNRLRSVGSNSINSMMDGIKGSFSWVRSFFSGIPSTLVGAMGNVWSWFYSVGQNMMSGLVKGIYAGWSWVVNAASSVARSALNAAKSFLGIASPSKEFAKVGKFTMEGFAQGIERTAGEAEDAVQKAMEDVASVQAPEISATMTADVSNDARYGAVIDEIGKLAESIERMRFTIDIDGKTTASILYPHIDREMYEQATAVGAI